MRKLLLSFACTLYLSFTLAQVGINTETPQTTLDVNGSIQLREELRINENPGQPGEIYFSKGSIEPEWIPVNVPFLEEGQYQLVNTYAKKDEVGIDWVGNFGGCIVDIFPFTENFEDTSASRACWTNERVAGTTDWTYAAGAGGGNPTTDNTSGGSNVLNARFTQTAGQTTKLVSPVMNLSSLKSPRLSFYYAQAANGGQNQLKVYYRVSPEDPWVQFSPTYSTSITAWTQVTLYLPNPSSTYQIAFEGISNSGRANVIDDVVVDNDNCMIKNFPFTETFEANAGSTRDCWNPNDYVSANQTPWTYAVGSSGGSINADHTADPGTLNARFTTTTNRVTRLVSPAMDLTSLSSPRLRFWYGQQVNGGQNQLRVYYRTSPGSAWTLIPTATYTSSVTAWTQVTLTLPNPSASYQIAFEGTTTGTAGRANVVDDVTVDDANTPCSTIKDFPFTENFEITSGSRGCWNPADYVSAGQTPWIYDAGSSGGNITADHTTGTGNVLNARFTTTTNRVTRLVSPVMDISSLSTPKLTFWYGQQVNSGQNQLRVYYRTTTGGSWTLIPSAVYTSSITAWTEVNLTLPNPSTTYQIAFEGTTTGTAGRANVIDDVVISDGFYFWEGFETDSPTKGSWTQIHESGATNWNLSATGSSATITTAHGGSLNASFRNSGTTNSTKLVSPAFSFSNYASNLKLSFWYGQPQNSSATNRNYLGVYYRTSANGDWIQIGTDYTGNVTTWTQILDLDLPNSAGAAYYQIAFDALQRGTGHANVLDDVQIRAVTAPVITPTEGYDPNLSTTNNPVELISDKNWRRIPGLDTEVSISSADNKISVIFQTGVETRMNPTGTGNQIAGSIRFMCGIFRREQDEPVSSSILVAVRGDQINNTIGKAIVNKTQSTYTLTYTVDTTPPGDYVFSVACRRLSLTDGGGNQATSFLSIGNSVNSGDNVTNDFMLNSILKMDIIELITVTIQ